MDLGIFVPISCVFIYSLNMTLEILVASVPLMFCRRCMCNVCCRARPSSRFRRFRSSACSQFEFDEPVISDAEGLNAVTRAVRNRAILSALIAKRSLATMTSVCK